MDLESPPKRVMVVGGPSLLRGLLKEEKLLQVVGHTQNMGMVPALVAASGAEVLVLSAPAGTEEVALLLGYLRMSMPGLYVVLVADGAQGASLEKWQQAGVDLVVTEGDDYQGLIRAIAGAPNGAEPGKKETAVRQPAERALKLSGTAGEVVMVVGSKGGVGKTFLAVNLAVCLKAAGGVNVALMDLDLCAGDAAVHLDLVGSPSIVELLPHLPEPAPGTLEKFLCYHQLSGIRLLPAPARPELAELISGEQVKQVLELLRREFRVVVVDTPPEATNELIYEVMEETGKVMLVSTLDAASLRHTRVTIETMEKLDYPVSQRVSLVLNRYRRQGPVSISQVEEFVGLKAVATLDDEPRLVEASIFSGRPLVLTHRNHALAGTLEKLARSVLPGDPGPARQARATDLRRWWRRWVG